MDVMNRLHMLRESLIAARDCVQPAETQIPQHVAGLRAGLEIAVKAVTEEIKWAELDEQDAKRINNIIKG